MLMTRVPALDAAPLRYVRWLHERALPLWGQAGRDPAYGFAERLDFEGRMVNVGYTRVRLLARQVAVYAQAAKQGDARAVFLADHGWKALKQHFWRRGRGWVACVSFGGGAIGETLTLYDQAFALYACAWWGKLFQDHEALDLAFATLDCIDRHLRCGDLAGWRSSTSNGGRDQNSHMHYLEALLELHAAFPDDRFARRITEILALLANHLLDKCSGTVTEYFANDWSSAAPAIVEPGHQYEWVWLLHRASVTGFDCGIDTCRMMKFADAHGWHPRHGLIVDSCTTSGVIIDNSFRLWPHCEAIKALCVIGSPQADHTPRIHSIVQRLFDHFLVPSDTGLWVDRRTCDLKPLVDYVPASSLYHLWEAARALKTAGLVSQAPPPCLDVAAGSHVD